MFYVLHVATPFGCVILPHKMSVMSCARAVHDSEGHFHWGVTSEREPSKLRIRYAEVLFRIAYWRVEREARKAKAAALNAKINAIVAEQATADKFEALIAEHPELADIASSSD